MSVAGIARELQQALRRLDERRLDALLRLERQDLRQRVEARAELCFLDREHGRLPARLAAARRRPDTVRGAFAAWFAVELALIAERLDEWIAHH
jgi:hypothetical protein